MGKREKILEMMATSHAAMMEQLDEIDSNRRIYPLWMSTMKKLSPHGKP
jgi:hypothetical protein